MPLVESTLVGLPALGSSRLVLYAVRVLVGALPWGEGINQLPYRPSELGAADAIAPVEMVVLQSGQFWMRDPVDGSVCIANPTRGTAHVFDLLQAVGNHLSGASPLAFTLTTISGADVAAVVGGRSQPSAPMRYVLCLGLGSGVRVLPLLAPAGVVDAPTGLCITSKGNIWILYPKQAILLDNAGKQLKTIAAPGILLVDGAYLTKGKEPCLFGPDGTSLGTVKVIGTNEPIPFLVAGPDDVLLAPCFEEEIPEFLRDSIDIIDIYRLYRDQMKIELHDRIAWPTLVHQKPAADGPQDGLPVKSYFPPGSVAFSPDGDIWILEHTATQCRFHVFRRIRNVDEWVRKFGDLKDLNAGELELYRAEARCRAGLAVEAGDLGRSYANMVWMRANLLPRIPTTTENLLRSLDQARPAADRK